MKKITSLLLAAVMIMGMLVTGLSAGITQTVMAANEPDNADVPSGRFADVPVGEWYKDAVDYVAERNLMKGVGDGTRFDPNGSMTRAMVVTVLYRLDGSPEVDGDTPFTDLGADWYADAVAWAYESEVVTGTSPTTFSPDGNVTREQIATILYRYANYKKLDTSASADLSKFPDSTSVGSWAYDAIKWANGAELITGAVQDGVTVLAPQGEASRAQVATILMRFCEYFDIFAKGDGDEGGNGEGAEPFFPASLEEVLADIQSDRVKKVIFDADAGNEIDDQYALAYAVSSDRINVVSVNASQFLNTALAPTREAAMMDGYNEIKKVLSLIGREDIPVYKGVGDTVTKPDDDGIGYPTVIPKDAEAVDNIISTAKSSNEIVYIMTTGCATNIACAIAKDPSIKDKICVIWLGANHYDSGAGEFNFGQDRTAGRYMMNSGVKLVWVPAQSSDSTKGTQVLKTNRAFLEENFKGSDPLSRFFGGELPLEHDGSFETNKDGWWHIFWDSAATAILDTPELCEFEIIKLWRIRGDDTWDSNTKDRPSCIVLNRIKEPQTVLDNMAAGINSFVK